MSSGFSKEFTTSTSEFLELEIAGSVLAFMQRELRKQ